MNLYTLPESKPEREVDPMKRILKKSLSLLLAVLLLAGACCVSAFADTTERYRYYTVIGDSNATAYGTAAYFENAGSETTVKDGDLIPGSYPAIVADALGIPAENVNVRAHSGWRTLEFLRALSDDPSVKPDGLSDTYYHALGFVDPSTLIGEGDRIREAVRKADFITVDFGSNDIFTHAINLTTAQHPELNGGSIFSTAIALGTLPIIIADFEANLQSNADAYAHNMDLVIAAIRDINPTAKILVLGAFCPITFDIELAEDTYIDFRSFSDVALERCNGYIQNESPYKDEYTFIDISRTKCYGLSVLDFEKLFSGNPDVKYSAVKMVHPTEAGHQYIAKHILSAVGTLSPDVLRQDFVERLYQVCLERDASEMELAYYLWELTQNGKTGIEVAYNFIFSDEFVAKNYCDYHYVFSLYKAFMGRTPAESETGYWVWRLQQGSLREEIFNEFAVSQEFGSICTRSGISQGSALPITGTPKRQGGYCSVAGCTFSEPIAAFSARLYTVCLDRDPAPEEIDAWHYSLVHGDYTATSAVRFFLFCEEFESKGYDNAAFVRHVYSAMLDREPSEGEVSYWCGVLETGMTREALFEQFADSDEFRVICAEYSVIHG